jgi:hypothetical protein
MKIFKYIITAFALLCLHTECYSQYCLMGRGQTNPFDSAVAIHLPEYRKIRIKVLTADSLIQKLNIEINELTDFVIKSEQAKQILIEINDRHQKTIADKDKSIKGLHHDFNELLHQCNKKSVWWNSRGAHFGGGAIASLVVIYVVKVILID